MSNCESVNSDFGPHFIKGNQKKESPKICGGGSKKVFRMDDISKSEYESDSSSETTKSSDTESTSTFDEEFINETVDKIVNKKVYVVWDKVNKLNMAIFDDEDDADEYCNKLNKKILDMICKNLKEDRLLSFTPMTDEERKELYSVSNPWNKEETDEDKLETFGSQLACLMENKKYDIKYVVLEYPLNRKGLPNNIFKGVHLLV